MRQVVSKLRRHPCDDKTFIITKAQNLFAYFSHLYNDEKKKQTFLIIKRPVIIHDECQRLSQRKSTLSV